MIEQGDLTLRHRPGDLTESRGPEPSRSFVICYACLRNMQAKSFDS
jgi:hypothetical protein